MNKSILRLSFPAFALVIGSLAFPFLIRAQSAVLTPDVNIDQTQLLSGNHEEQDAIVAFLLSLRLPLDPGVKSHN
jgi:hypothetical protein